MTPFSDATTFGERENACISEVIPTLLKLKKELETLDPRGAYTMQAELQTQLQAYFFGGDSRQSQFPTVESTEIYAIATLLDPRFKIKVFQDKNAAESAVLRLEDMTFASMKDRRQQSHPPPQKRTKLTGFFAPSPMNYQVVRSLRIVLFLVSKMMITRCVI